MFRTADAFLVEQVVLCGISSTPPSPEIHKTALGAEDTVRWSYYHDTMEAIDTLRANGYRICCLEQVKGSIELQKFKVSVSTNLLSTHRMSRSKYLSTAQNIH